MGQSQERPNRCSQDRNHASGWNALSSLRLSTRDALHSRSPSSPTHFGAPTRRALVHIQNTHHQYNLPTPKARINYRCNRDGIAEKFTDPSVFQSISSDIELAGHYDSLIKELELFLTRKAKVHDPDNFYRLRSVHGIGKILAMTLLYEIHDIDRFERVHNFASYARLVKCEKSSSGKRLGTGGAKIGNVHLKWAFSEAAVLFLRANPPAQRYLEKLRKKHGKAKSLSILAHKLGRAVYFMMKNKKPFSMDPFRIA